MPLGVVALPPATPPVRNSDNNQNTSLTQRIISAVETIFSAITIIFYEMIQSVFQIGTSLYSCAVEWLNREEPIALEPLTEKICELNSAPFPLESEVTQAQMKQRTDAALEQLDQIEIFLQTTPQRCLPFTFTDPVRAFNLDAILESYEANLSPLEFLPLFDEANPGPQYAFGEQRDRFEAILQKYEWEEKGEPDQAETIRTHLSRFIAIFAAKKKRIGPDIEQQKAIQQQIRQTIIQIIDADADCIDQVLARFEKITLDLIASELKVGEATPQEQLQTQAAFVLFQYKSNLITATCQKQNQDDDLMTKIERIVRQRAAPVLNMTSHINRVGAVLENLAENLQVKVSHTYNALFRRYLDEPLFLKNGQIDHWSDLDERPIAYFFRELIAPETYNPTNNLRNNLISWSKSYFGLEEEVGAKILTKGSADPKNDFSIGGNLNLAGLILLLESAGIIKMVPSIC